jgi:glycosyl transferase family 25
MKVFVINLDRDVERMKVINARLNELNVEYERVSARDAKLLNLNANDASVDRFRWWCAVGRPIRPGEIGCALSHYDLYRKIVEPVCILEDDVIIEDQFIDVLKRVEEWINPKLPQVVLLSNHTKRKYDDIGIYKIQNDMYAEGYVITPAAAKALINVNYPLQRPCDHWGVWAKRGIIGLYHAIPTVCSQDQSQFVSGTVDAKSFNVSNLSTCRFVFHKICRVVGKMFDRLLP